MLTGMGVRLKEHNINSDMAAKSNMRRMGGRGVPFIIIGERKISGYNPGAMINALNRLK